MIRGHEDTSLNENTMIFKQNNHFLHHIAIRGYCYNFKSSTHYIMMLKLGKIIVRNLNSEIPLFSSENRNCTKLEMIVVYDFDTKKIYISTCSQKILTLTNDTRLELI